MKKVFFILVSGISLSRMHGTSDTILSSDALAKTEYDALGCMRSYLVFPCFSVPYEKALFDACKEGHEAIVASCLSYYAERMPKKLKKLLRTRTLLGYTPLHLAVQNNHYAIVERLIAAGASTNSQLRLQIMGETPLYAAAKNRNGALVKLLLKNGAIITSCVANDEELYHFVMNEVWLPSQN